MKVDFKILKLSPLQRLGLWIVAIVSMIGAILLLWSAGLPNKAEYSGIFVDGLGFVAPEIGEFAPPFMAQTPYSQMISLADFQGESVIINFWATWCVPCAIEMPELQTLYEETNTAILAVNIGESPHIVAEWVNRYSLTFPIVLDPQQVIYSQYRIIGQPTTFVIAPDGIISHIFYGATTFETLQRALETHQANG